MKTLITLTFALIATLTLTGCASAPTAPLIGENPRGAAASTGGDAEGRTSALDAAIVFAQPGADARSSKVKNEDQVNSTQAAPAFTLNLVQDFTAAVEGDPIVQSMMETLAITLRQFRDAEDDAGRTAARAALAEEREALATRMRELRESLSETAAARVDSLYYCPVVIMSNGESAAKLDAKTAEAAGRGLVAAILPSLDAETAAVVAAALKPSPPAPSE